MDFPRGVDTLANLQMIFIESSLWYNQSFNYLCTHPPLLKRGLPVRAPTSNCGRFGGFRYMVPAQSRRLTIIRGLPPLCGVHTWSGEAEQLVLRSAGVPATRHSSAHEARCIGEEPRAQRPPDRHGVGVAGCRLDAHPPGGGHSPLFVNM